VVILFGNVSLLCVELAAGIGNVQRRSVLIVVFSVDALVSYEEGLSNLQNKLLPKPFI
jgi:hypothetical protein